MTPVTNVEFSLAARLTRQSPRGHRFSLTGLAPLWSPLICPGSKAVGEREVVHVVFPTRVAPVTSRSYA